MVQSENIAAEPEKEKLLITSESDSHNKLDPVGDGRATSERGETSNQNSTEQREDRCVHDSCDEAAAAVGDEDEDEDEDGTRGDDEGPDGGWGWVVCFGSFMITFIQDGSMFSFGVLMLALVADLGQDESITSWIGSVQWGTLLIMGPGISIMLQTYSIRQVVVVGSIIATCGFFASVFAPNVYVLIFTYGILGGIGFGMVFLPAIIVLVPYFNKRRAIATGLAMSGSGLGTFFYGWIIDKLLDAYQWRGTMLILTGLVLNYLTAGLLFRPLETERRRKRNRNEEHIPLQRASHGTERIADEDFSKNTLKEKNDESDTSKDCEIKATPEDVTRAGDNHTRTHKSEDNINRIKPILNWGADSNSLRNEETEKGSSNDCLHSRREVPRQQVLSPFGAESLSKSQTISVNGVNSYNSQYPHHSQPHIRQDQHHHSCHELGWSKVKDVGDLNKGQSSHFLGESTAHLAAVHYFGSMTSFGAAMTHKNSTENVDVITDNTVNKGCNSYRQYLSRWFPVRLLKDPLFLLLLVGFVMWTGQSITLTYLPTYAVSLGIERSEAAYLISIIGIANIVCRPVAGLILDCVSIPSIALYTCALALAAVINFVIPLCTSFHSLAICSAVFGLCMAVAVSMRTIVLVDQLGVDALTESFGIVALFQGIAFMVVPPIAGHMLNRLESCTPTFWMSGTMYTLSATMMLGAFCLARRGSRETDRGISNADI